MSQPKALFLADVIEADPASKTHHYEAAAELRRLHKVIEELLEALKLAVRQNDHDMLMTGEELRICRAAIAKADGA
jgi:hypothetical protein